MADTMIQTKSDWFECKDKDGKIFHLEVFGVTKHSKHCMRLLYEGAEVAVFHLEDINAIIYSFALKWITYNNVHGLMTRQVILDHSK